MKTTLMTRCKHTGNEIKFEKMFEADGTFGAVSKAEKWAKDEGYTIGSMCRNAPIGLSKSHTYIAKWDNINVSERRCCEGLLLSDDFREGDVTVRIFK